MHKSNSFPTVPIRSLRIEREQLRSKAALIMATSEPESCEETPSGAEPSPVPFQAYAPDAPATEKLSDCEETKGLPEAALNDPRQVSEPVGGKLELPGPDDTPKAGNKHKRAARVSQKKIDANRQNAKRSTGPKTKRGKDNSRCNAVKHGLSAELIPT